MRTTTAVLLALAAAGPLAGPAAAEQPDKVLATKARFFGAEPYCPSTCPMTFAVRPGERFLHLVVTGQPRPGAVDVATAHGTRRVCGTSKGLTLPIDGLASVTLTPVVAPACGEAVQGTVMALFAKQEVTFSEALLGSEPDGSRPTSGGY